MVWTGGLASARHAHVPPELFWDRDWKRFASESGDPSAMSTTCRLNGAGPEFRTFLQNDRVREWRSPLTIFITN